MTISKALTFRASSIGDCLMGKYLLENIHAHYPEARLGIVVASRGAMIRDLFAAYPWLEIIEANRRTPRELLSLLKNFQESDVVITQYAGKQGGKFSFASKLAARTLAKQRGLVGFTDASRFNGLLYDKLIPHTLSAAPAALEREALRAVGVPITYERPMMQCTPMPQSAEKFGLIAGKYIVVHLFAGNKGRGLSPEKKRELLTVLAEKLPGIRLVISGGREDKEEALAAAKDLSATVIAGEASLQELMNLIRTSRGVVSVDTGVAHIATQLGKPLIVLATCLGLHWWGKEQYGTDAPISLFTRADLCAAGHDFTACPDCLNTIEFETVADRAAVIF